MPFVLSDYEQVAGIDAAVAALRAGRPALDAVEDGIRLVESDPTMHSVGIHGWPNILGQVELDAAIMDGAGLRSGAVGALQGYAHPISIARELMARLPHVMLVGEGAALFAAECGAEPAAGPTSEILQQRDAWLAEHVPPELRSEWAQPPLARWVRMTAEPLTSHGTTILLAGDNAGNLASGVSTSGWGLKYPGRLGDSPIVGAGSYADSRYGAAACTGLGELIIRAGTSRAVVLYMKMGMDVEAACHEAAADLRSLAREYRGGVTIHAVDRAGHPFVLAVGVTRRADEGYWFWAEGMQAPEPRQPAREEW